jgi:hypothetical protein
MRHPYRAIQNRLRARKLSKKVKELEDYYTPLMDDADGMVFETLLEESSEIVAPLLLELRPLETLR